MYTYQDFEKVMDNDKAKMDFVLGAIRLHKQSDEYKEAETADLYARHKNKTIMDYQKILYTVSGVAVPDNWSANYKMRTTYFDYFIKQQNQYLLGNGATWGDKSTADKLGNNFDKQLQKAGRKALICGTSFGFYNYDHMEVFSLLEFAPLYDEENGALMAGIRFWQISNLKPLRATLYEIDGYTDYIWENGVGKILAEKRPYILQTTYSEVDGLEIYDGRNYPSFPIIPMWANENHQSELVGLREQVDAYDLIKSGFANDLDDVSQIYWTISNAGGMDDIDLAQFVQRMKTVKAAAMEDGQVAEAHSIEIPYNARESLLTLLRKDMYRTFMALDVEEIAGGAVTATQIKAAYEPLNSKVDEYEYCVQEFIEGILKVAGIEDEVTFTRSKIVNVNEEVQTLLSAGEYLTDDYITRKILELYGDGDMAEDMLEEKAANELNRGGNLFQEEPTGEAPPEGTGAVNEE